MKIESILQRDGGSVIDIGGVKYHFRPSPDDGGRHVAVVNNPLHAARFISITEGYRMLPDEGPSAEDLRAAQDAEAARLAAEAEAAAAAERVAIEAARRAAEAEAQEKAVEDTKPPEAPKAPLNPDTMDRAGMVALHEQRFGRKPHHRLSDDKLRELLDAAE